MPDKKSVIYEGFHDALQRWWRALWPLATAKLPLLLALSTDYERGVQAGRLFSDEAFTIKEWDEVEPAAKADEQLSRQIGHEVGTAIFGGNILSLKNIAQTFIDAGMAAIFSGEFDESAPDALFDPAYDEIEGYLTADNIKFDVRVPLVGLLCDTNPIHLDETTEIVQLMDMEHPSWFDLEILLINAGERRPLGESTPLPVHYRSTLYIRYSFPKLIGPNTRSEVEALAFLDDVQKRVRDCLRALASVTFLQIIAWPAHVREMGPTQRNDRGLRLRQPQLVAHFIEPGGTISADLTEPLMEAWTRLRHDRFNTYQTNRAIGLALDRLSGLGSKLQSPREQLVDTVISCEAFFTLGNASRQELAFRAAMAAAYMAPTLKIAFNKATVFSLMERAYNARSRIVHGEDLRAKDLTHDGAVPSLATSSETDALRYFVYWTGEIVRQGIIIRILATDPGDAVSIDWNELLFGEEKPSASSSPATL